MQRKDSSVSYDAGTSPVIYRGLPTNFYLGANAAGTSNGYKDLDDIRIYNRAISGMESPLASGDEFSELAEAGVPLPIADGVTAYFPMTRNVIGYGWENTHLTITQSLPQNNFFYIDSETMQVSLVTGTPADAPVDAIANVSGSFPILVNGKNAIQIVHDGAAASLEVAIEDKRRYL